MDYNSCRRMNEFGDDRKKKYKESDNFLTKELRRIEIASPGSFLGQ